MLEHYILYGALIAVAVICSYRSGQKQGTNYGIDLCLERYHESLNNLTPADVFYGCDTEILNQREIIKQNTLAMRKQLHYDKQHNPMN